MTHDLGPRRLHGTIISILSDHGSFRPMPEGASWRDEQSRAWLKGARRDPNSRKRETNAAWRASNLDRARAQERLRSQRRRDRQKGITA